MFFGSTEFSGKKFFLHRECNNRILIFPSKNRIINCVSGLDNYNTTFTL